MFPEVELSGQLVSRRSLSKKLVFYDLELDTAGEGSGGELQGVELVLRELEGRCSLEDVAEMRHTLKLGDRVRVEAVEDEGGGGTSFLLLRVLQRQPWKQAAPGACFKPRPLLLPGAHRRSVPAARASAAGGAGVAGGGDAHAARAGDAGAARCGDGGGGGPSGGGEGGAAERGVCKFWVLQRECAKGDACPLLHPLADMRQAWITARRRRRRELSHEAGNPHAMSAALKSARAAVFADWLVATFGRELLSSGSGVLDVAGGRGELAFELSVRRSIPCTTLDPRPPKLSRKQRQTLERQGEATAAPAHVQVLFDERLWNSAGETGDAARSCSLVVGLHPDEATEAIVDFADLFGKPFAVLPCCVFARQFPHRRYLDVLGLEQPVATHSDLVQYLLRRQGAERHYLPFDGSNQVVFRAPATTPCG